MQFKKSQCMIFIEHFSTWMEKYLLCVIQYIFYILFTISSSVPASLLRFSFILLFSFEFFSVCLQAQREQSILLELSSVIIGKFSSEHGPQFPVKCQWVCKGLLKIVCIVFEEGIGEVRSLIVSYSLWCLSVWHGLKSPRKPLLSQHLKTEISLKRKDWIWLWGTQNYILCTVYCYSTYFKNAFELNSVNVKSIDLSPCIKCSRRKNSRFLICILLCNFQIFLQCSLTRGHVQELKDYSHCFPYYFLFSHC